MVSLTTNQNFEMRGGPGPKKPKYIFMKNDQYLPVFITTEHIHGDKDSV